MVTGIPTPTTLEVEAESGAAAYEEKRTFLSPTASYILRRLGLYVITLWGSLTASFFFFRLLPGDPISGIITQLQTRGQYSSIDNTQDMVAYYRKEFGLDGSLGEQYVSYYQKVLTELDFGHSVLSYPTPATDLIIRALPWTLFLIGFATLLGWALGVILGTLIAWKRKSRWSEWVTNTALTMSHVPAYFVALILLIFFSYRLGWLPSRGAYVAGLEPSWSLDFILSALKYAFLPVLATVLVAVANWMLSTRALVVSILGEDFLTYANAKGLSSRRILTSYVLRNAWLPQIAALGMAMGAVVSGNILIERLFVYPGLGNLLVDSVIIKDVNTAMATVTLLIFMVLTMNLIIDLCLPLIDPRVKFTG